MTGGDDPSRGPILNLPPMTKALVVANFAVFGVMFFLPDGVDEAIDGFFGFTPANEHALSAAALFDPLTYQFLHAGFAHVGINMLSLVAFGSGVERRFGAWRFLVFYLICGVAGAFFEFAVDPGSSDVMIGASAAVSGLFGAILRFDIFRRGFWALVALWLVMNVVAGVSGVGSEGEPVAWIAHIGGFFAGLALYSLFARRGAGA